MGIFPGTPSFTNMSFVDSRDPLTAHSYLLHTLRVFVGKRGLTGVQNVLLPATHCSKELSLTVYNLICLHPIHLLQLA